MPPRARTTNVAPVADQGLFGGHTDELKRQIADLTKRLANTGPRIWIGYESIDAGGKRTGVFLKSDQDIANLAIQNVPGSTTALTVQVPNGTQAGISAPVDFTPALDVYAAQFGGGAVSIPLDIACVDLHGNAFKLRWFVDWAGAANLSFRFDPTSYQVG
jgi:hypothetical protein